MMIWHNVWKTTIFIAKTNSTSSTTSQLNPLVILTLYLMILIIGQGVLLAWTKLWIKVNSETKVITRISIIKKSLMNFLRWIKNSLKLIKISREVRMRFKKMTILISKILKRRIWDLKGSMSKLRLLSLQF
jgi:hypothetical protein